MLKENFSTRLRQLRLSNKITQKALGVAIGVSKQAICDMEQNRRTTTIDNLISIANFFCVSTDYLLGRSDDLEQLCHVQPTLPKEEEAHLASYRTLSKSDRKKLLEYMELLQAAHRKD